MNAFVRTLVTILMASAVTLPTWAGGGLAGETYPDECSDIILSAPMTVKEYLDFAGTDLKSLYSYRYEPMIENIRRGTTLSKLQAINILEAQRTVEFTLARNCRGGTGNSPALIIRNHGQMLLKSMVAKVNPLNGGEVIEVLSADTTAPWITLNLRVTAPGFTQNDLIFESVTPKHFKLEVINKVDGKIHTSVQPLRPGSLNKLFEFPTWELWD